MQDKEVQLWKLTEWDECHEEKLVKSVVKWVHEKPDRLLSCSKYQTTEPNFFITNDQDGPEILKLGSNLHSFCEWDKDPLNRPLFDYTIHLLEAKNIVGITPQELREYSLKHQDKFRAAEALLDAKLTANSRDMAILRNHEEQLGVYYPPRARSIFYESCCIPYVDVLKNLDLSPVGTPKQ